MPCPLCGGLIHPVAGRCRHCKADLSAHRSSRPAAAAALPPLVAATAPVDAAPRTEFAPLPFTAAPAAPVAYAADVGSAPVLPPRPTGRQEATSSRGLWRSWPIVVIVLAAIAIVAALVLMMWPPATPEAKADPRVLRPPPAPERMDVTPVLPTPQPNIIPGAPGGADPWAAPTPPPGTVPQQVPDPAPTPDPDDLSADPFANPFGLGGGGPTGGAGGMFGGDARSYITLAARACKKLASCSPDLGEYCTVIDTLADGTLPTCPAAQRCVDRIEGLSCSNLQGDSTGDLLQLMSTLQECMNLANC